MTSRSVTKTHFSYVGNERRKQLAHSHVGPGHAAKLFLEDGEEVPYCGGEGLGVQHAQGAATLEEGAQTAVSNIQLAISTIK